MFKGESLTIAKQRKRFELLFDCDVGKSNRTSRGPNFPIRACRALFRTRIAVDNCEGRYVLEGPTIIT